jgi:OCT family organic cation transporter-like MFS transporter 18
LGADPTTFGQLQTVFAVTQLLGGPLFGRLGDTLGERFALILAFTAATMSYFLMGISDNIMLLFLSRLPSVFMHTMQGDYFFACPSQHF